MSLEMHCKLSNILQQLLLANALLIPARFDVTLEHHSDQNIYLQESQFHWKVAVNETPSWSIFSSISSTRYND